MKFSKLTVFTWCAFGTALLHFHAQQPEQLAPAAEAKPPSDIKFIDPHVHAMSVTEIVP